MTSARLALTVFGLAVALLAMTTTLCAWRRRRGLSAEKARKLAHTGLGFATLSYPFLFDRVWPVTVLNALVVIVMIVARTSRAAARVVGGAVHDVGRRSFGEFYFPAAVVVLFALTDGDPIRFGAPILTLTFADAAAALVGTRYGRSPLGAVLAPKTIEGSAAFFIVAFVCVHVPLIWLRATDVPTAIAVAGGCAAVSTVIEALCDAGTDNLFVPLGCYGALDAMLRSAA